MDLKISCRVEGPEFLYASTDEWGHLNDVGVAWMKSALATLADVAQKAAKDGKGGLTATFTQQWDGGPVETMTVYNLSRKDVTKVQRAYLQKYDEIVRIAEGKHK